MEIAAVEQALGVLGQELHREVDAVEFPAGYRQVVGHRGAGGQQQCVDVVDEIGDAHRAVGAVPHVGACHKGDAFLAHQIDPTLDDALVELHVRNPVHQEAADAVGAFVHGDLVTRLVQLRGRGQSSGSGAHDRHGLAGTDRWGLGDDPAFGETAVNDRHLYVLDGHRRVGDAEDAGTFARCGADAAREFGEVVGLVQPIKGVAPVAAVDKVVPLRDQVVDRTPAATVDHVRRLAERHAAVHAPRRLGGEPRLVVFGVDLLEVDDPLDRVAVGGGVACVLLEAGRLTHR